MTTAVRSPAVRSPADPRGTGFRPTEPEAMGSVSGTHDLTLAGPEPQASGSPASGRGAAGGGKARRVTGATWI